MREIEQALRLRANDKCELCGGAKTLRAQPVPPHAGGSSALRADRAIFVCEVCADQIGGTVPLDEKHWFCLREAAWSNVPAVQVASLMLLNRLDADWARALLSQVYVDEGQSWINEASDTASRESAETVDSNGTKLADGDSVTLIKDLDVKGAGFIAKRGTLVKRIRVTGDGENIEGTINGTTLVLKTKFLKKA